MSAVDLLAQPAAERLGRTLLHFCWEGGLIALLYAAVRAIPVRPDSRYLLACGAMATIMTAPIITWSVLGQSDAAAVEVDRTARVPGSASSAAATLPIAVHAEVSQREQFTILQWAVVVWLLGAGAFSARLAGGWITAVRLRWKLARPVPLEWQQTLGRLSARIGISRDVCLRISALVESPTVIGALRPLVLVPVGMLSGLGAEQVEALLLHELAHIRRHDYLVNLVQNVAEALLFYHPAVWWVSGHMRTERERCCDDIAVSLGGDVLVYVSALAELESSRPAHLAAVAANGGSLADRIAHLLGERRPAVGNGLGRGTLVGAVLLAAAAYSVFAQTTPRPEFQVASIKLNTANTQHHVFRPRPGGRLTAENATLQMLILNAYEVQGYQVLGGPAWISTDGYDIEAKPESETSVAEMRLMVQSLLAERFKLAMHRETRELPVYALASAKGSFDPPPVKDGGCVTPQPGTQLPAGAFPCGKVGISGSPWGVQMNGRMAPMAEFIRMLAMVMGRPIVDHSGFTGELDVHLSFAPDESLQGLMPGGPSASPPSTDPGGPNIFAALQEQLGLKLTSSKGPVEVLVIDHVERPTAN